MRAFVLTVLALSTGGLHAAPAAVSIRLPAQAEVPEGPVLLGQVALLSSADPDLLRRLVELPIGPSPSPGRGRELDRERLQQWIASRVGLGAAQLQWQGAAQASVRVRSRTVPGSELAAAALRGGAAWLQEHEPGARARLAQALPRDLEVADAEVELQARPPAHPVRERMLVWVEVRRDGRPVRAVPVRLDVAIGSTSGAAGRAAPTRPAPVVQRGDWAWMHSRVGTVESQVRVEVLQDGRMGERVRVRPSGAPESLLAGVLATGRLEVAR